MCGRFNLTAPGDMLADEFDLDEPPVLRPRFNIAPSQAIVTVACDPGGRRLLVERRWGMGVSVEEAREPQATLFPDLERTARRERRLINARSESAARAPAFREAFANRRCLIPATGFYEWQQAPGARPQPWLFQRADGRPFAFAGLWEPAREGGTASCLILTTASNELTRGIHDRMPVILARSDCAAWLDPGTSASLLRPLLRPFPASAMTALPVGPAVNDPRVDDPSCIAPIAGDRP